MNLAEEYWTPKELTEQLRPLGLASNPRTLARWELCRKGPPATIVGGRKVYRRKSVLEWLQSRETPVKPSGPVARRQRAEGGSDGVLAKGF